MGILAAAKAYLKEVNDRLAALEKAFNEAVEKKDMLEKKEHWRETVETLYSLFANVLGDVIVSAGCILYLGRFIADFRSNLVKSWHSELGSNNLKYTPGCNVETTLADPVKLESLQLCYFTYLPTHCRLRTVS